MVSQLPRLSTTGRQELIVPEQKSPLVVMEDPRPPEQVLLTEQLFVWQIQELPDLVKPEEHNQPVL